MQNIPLVFAEGVAITCGILMLVAALLLWQHHPKRPQWGLRWIALAMLLAAISNLVIPFNLSGGSWRADMTPSGLNLIGLLALMVGFGSLAALFVGIRDYVLKPLKWRWTTLFALWLLPCCLVIVNWLFFQATSLGDWLAAGVFLLCAWHTWTAAQQERHVGHLAISLALITQPLTMLSLTLFQVDLNALRYLAALPYVVISITILSACLTRLYKELAQELCARTQAQQEAESTRQALRRSHDLQQAILQHAPIPLGFTELKDNKAASTHWNKTWYATFGYSEAQTAGLTGDQFHFYVDPLLPQRCVDQLLEQGVMAPFETEVRDAKGDIRLCLIQGILLNMAGATYIISSCVDITKQRANENYLRQYQSMIQNTDDAMFVIENHVILFANQAAARMFGVSSKMLCGQSPMTFSAPLQPDGRIAEEAASAYLEQACAGIAQRFYWQHIRASGERFTAHVSLTLIPGKSQQVVAVLRDMTDELNKSDALALSEARLNTTITVSQTGAWEFHLDTGYLWCSKEYFTMLGYSSEDFVMDGQADLDKVWIELLHPDDLARSKQYFTDYLNSNSIGMYENQFRMRHKDGQWVWILSRGQTLKDAQGNSTDITVGTHINITAQKRIELQLNKARQLSDVIAKAQLQFILQSQHRIAFDGLLEDILSLTESEYGYIGEILRKPDGSPYLKTFTITNIAWNSETQAIYEQDSLDGMEFTNLKTLFGAVMVTGQLVIANQPATDPRHGGLPPGHPPLQAFLGIPVYHGNELVAMLGMANRPEGYDQAIVDYLAPLTATVGQLVMAIRKDKKQKETEQRLNSISNNLPNSMLYQLNCGKDGQQRQFTYLSEGVEPLHGLSRQALLSDAQLLYQQIHPDDALSLRHHELASIQHQTSFATEYRSLNTEGMQRWFYVSGTPSINSEGELVFDGIEVDITERKLIELALQEERERLIDVLEGTRAGTWDLNLATNSVVINARWALMLGYTPGELEPVNFETWRQLVHPDDISSALETLEQHLSGVTEFYTAEFRMRHKKEGWVWVQASGKVITTDADAKPLILRGTHLEITERKRAEQRLQELNISLESRIKERTEALSLTLESLKNTQDELIQSEKLAALGSLVAGLAHELNTPIGNAVTVSSTLTESCTEFQKKQQKGLTRTMLSDFVGTIDEASRMLTRNLERAAGLISSFKQVAVDQNNHQRRPFTLKQLLTEVQMVMTPGLRKAGVQVEIKCQSDLELDSYPGALTQALMIVIQNTLTHAFEDRQQGHILIQATSMAPWGVQLSISDNGIGIEPEHLNRIFEPFYTTKLGKGGSGLGLHICYNIVTATLGGKIRALSSPGEGLTILMELPIAAPALAHSTFEAISDNSLS